jgi:ATP-binding protein involved in chromosome partitioning
MPDSSQQVPVIAVASGKGGVGKTTVAVNLALALTAQGRRTGLIDADLYGPDVPRMMGLLLDSDWHDLDYLVMDLPPGTADIQQYVFALSDRPMCVLVVVTPQVIAHQDARRLIAHLRQRGGRGAAAIDVAGVENMSGQVCPSCGQTTALFPSAPPAESIWELIPKLAAVPFSHQAARDADEGSPVMVTGAVPEQVAAYQLIAERIGHQLGRT